MRPGLVVDLGCYDAPGDTFSSIGSLIDRYNPLRLIGFDMRCERSEFHLNGTDVSVDHAAAWTCAGTIGYTPEGNSTRIGGGVTAPCFDFSAWTREQGRIDILKMDIEGSEYDVLEKMRQDETDALVGLLIVEWHGDPLTGLRCEVAEWWN